MGQDDGPRQHNVTLVSQTRGHRMLALGIATQHTRIDRTHIVIIGTSILGKHAICNGGMEHLTHRPLGNLLIRQQGEPNSFHLAFGEPLQIGRQHRSGTRKHTDEGPALAAAMCTWTVWLADYWHARMCVHGESNASAQEHRVKKGVMLPTGEFACMCFQLTCRRTSEATSVPLCSREPDLLVLLGVLLLRLGV